MKLYPLASAVALMVSAGSAQAEMSAAEKLSALMPTTRCRQAGGDDERGYRKVWQGCDREYQA